MGFTNLIPVVFIFTGVALLVRAYLIGIKKKTSLISGLDEKKLKKVKNIDRLTKDYSSALVLMACACFISVVFLLYLGLIGKVLGFVLILLSAVNLSRITLDMDTKLKKKIY